MTKEQFNQTKETALSLNSLISVPATLEGLEGNHKIKIVGNSIRSVKPKEGEFTNRAIYQSEIEFSNGETRSVGVLDKVIINKLTLNSEHNINIAQSGDYKSANGSTYPNYSVSWGVTEESTQDVKATEAKETQAV
jgi:hypothetical protein